jgi:uncharacterized protein with PQ loop repeat
MIDAIGYAGMALVVISFFFKKIALMRTANIAGSILSLIYGALTQTYPTLILNAALILVNVIMLIVYFKDKQKQRQLK